MVGTPQLPLKYRRKGASDYRVYSPDLDMPFHSSASSFNSYRFGSDYSIPDSPTIYSSSSSIAPSSPVRSLYTPEPSSSPSAEPYIASSPRPSGRKGFWDVAFNYGPDFPYKSRPAVQPSGFSREQFVTRRRSSSVSAPTLVSDFEPSDYSEDNDPFNMDDDATDEENVPGIVTIVNSRSDLTLNGPGAQDVPRDDVADTRNISKTLTGEIDVAVVLLDLSRQARFTSVESSAVDVAIKPTTSPSLDLAQKEHLIVISDESSQAIEETSTFTHVVPESQAHLLSDSTDQDVELLKVNEQESHSISEAMGLSFEVSEPDISIPVEAVDDDVHLATNSKCIGAASGIHTDFEVSSENIATDDAVDVIGSKLLDEDEQTPRTQNLATIVEERPAVDPLMESIFSSVLTPLSSPTSSGSELSDLTEPLSGPSSPGSNFCELAGPPDDTRRLNEHDDLEASGLSSPVPGPSNPRCGSADQQDAPRKRKNGLSQKGARKRWPQTVLDEIAKESESDTKTGKKRRRSISGVDSRLSSPTPPASCSTVPKPRKKRSKNGTTSRKEDNSGSTKDSSSPLQTASTAPTHGSSLAPPGPDTDIVAPTLSDDDVNARAEMCGCLIQAMALSRASSMPASSLLREVLRENPHLTNQRSRSDWLGVVSLILESHDVFGRIDREGLDADDKPLEAQWFYVPENDPDQDRASLLREMMPPKRNETKKHKQYFYKPLGKISRWDSEDAP